MLRDPALATSYVVDRVDGQSLPTRTVLSEGGASLVPVTLERAVLTFDPRYTKWEMDLTGPVSMTSVVQMRPRGPALIGGDSVEVYLDASAMPVLAGRFTDTSLVLKPPGGITRPATSIDSLGAHAWLLRPGSPLRP